MPRPTLALAAAATRVVPLRPMPRPLGLATAVSLLAVSQTVGYGTVYYSYSIIAPHIAAAFGVGAAVPFTVISVAFLLAGLAGPWIGRLIDRFGGPRVMRSGSIAVAAIFAALALAPHFAIAAALIVVLQVVSVAVLYGAAFPTLALYGRDQGKRGMIWLGLIGGFASTIFWPLAGWMVGAFGWRLTLVAYALMHLLLALPAHAFIARHHIPGEDTSPPDADMQRQDARVSPRLAFWLVAGAFGVTGFVSTALLVHMVPLLALRGLGPQLYFAAALAGPAMMIARLSEALFWPRAHPIWSAIISAISFPLALVALISGLPALIAGCLFAVLYGVAHGLSVTSGGTLPLRVFGTARYGELLGRINAVRVVMGAAAPMLLALGLESGALAPPLLAGIAIAVTGLIPLLILAFLLFRPASPIRDIP